MNTFPRIGHGIDVHRFGDGDHVTLGGVRIPHDHGLIAHSDGDVALHALCDALLGALALGDIGKHFPDTDNAYRQADSRGLLRKVMELVRSHGYTVGNCDLTVLAERPKLSPHIMEMQQRIAADLGIAADCVSIKATTTEKLGFVGRKEGIEAHAVVMLFPVR
ncbi:2-C-methyl-D-erythritol 2,4-cyclodiphosphate synthase [Fluviicoccus keumensis]|uniref:2-C-methyl-D-erythritol 2,4-cyclodiphosphate synthase n=1 Tax=Fluviicoccus keumensis TaxID=1435465 RepID=A0A4Q7Z5W3_9GAMM|nr:2-C-methyl-D-erythritol 2,4-cyclodiphosphate synthase [Fluviicoccus keumensis]RZU45251.1 2-C-methyl-D-erythritol 2,4-cyclodiphosphate synthase [Fluviicoccus keumensis]